MSTRDHSKHHGPLRVVCIGGGTGLSTLLKGLKLFAHDCSPEMRHPAASRYPSLDLTAVVTVTDDGGSSGRLRRDFDILPPGDIRNCMVALSRDEDMLTHVFQHRFAKGRGLKGHSFGNLFLAALTQITGDFAHAVALASELLAITGRIYPSTASNVSLRATLANGEVVDGESQISRTTTAIRKIRLRPRQCSPLPETLRAIEQADLITLGPGSLYTSLIPNLLVDGIPQAIERSKAIKAYFVNLMWQPGETTGMRASDHIRAILDHARAHVVDFAILNSAPISRPLRRRYATQSAEPVENDFEEIRKLNVQVAALNLLGDSEKARHDSDKAALVALQLARKARRLQLTRKAG